MGQQVWNMNSITGDHFSLGLYHGEESGHLMVYLNDEIFLIDFNILEDKSYQFYLGPEFMKLSISKSKDTFKYDLKVDLETPTPLNTSFQKAKDEDEKTLLYGLILVSIVLLTIFIYNYYVRYKF